MRILLWIFIIFLNISVFATGTLQFCDAVDATGKPVDTFESLILSPAGQIILLHYSSDNESLNTDQLKLEIAELKNHSFQKTDMRIIPVDPKNKIHNIPYTLKSDGDYRFRLYDKQGTLLAEEILSVSLEMTEAGSNRETSGSKESVDFAEHADLQFSDLQQDHYNTEFSFRSTKGKVLLILDPFDATDPMRLLDIWQNENDQYKLFIRSEKAEFIAQDSVGIYELTFPAMEDFKVNVHTTSNKLITSGYISFK